MKRPGTEAREVSWFTTSRREVRCYTCGTPLVAERHVSMGGVVAQHYLDAHPKLSSALATMTGGGCGLGGDHPS